MTNQDNVSNPFPTMHNQEATPNIVLKPHTAAVSIIVTIVAEDVRLTAECLEAIELNAPTSVAYEILIVHHGCSADLQQFLQQAPSHFPNVRVLDASRVGRTVLCAPRRAEDCPPYLG